MLQGLDPVLEGIVADLDKVTDFSGMIQMSKPYDDDEIPLVESPSESTSDIISSIKDQLEAASKNSIEAKAAKKAAEEAETLEDLQKKYAKKQEEKKAEEVKKTKLDIESDEKVQEAEAEAKKKVAEAEKAA